MKRLLAALLFLIASALPAQTVFFSGGNAWVNGNPLLTMDWLGQPAFLSVCGNGTNFLDFGLAGQTNPQKVTFTLRAAAFWDPRTQCSAGAPIYLNILDIEEVAHLGNMDASGQLVYYPQPGKEVLMKLDPWTNRNYSKAHGVSYCHVWRGCTGCWSMQTGYAPPFAAVILTVQ